MYAAYAASTLTRRSIASSPSAFSFSSLEAVNEPPPSVKRGPLRSISGATARAAARAHAELQRGGAG